MTELPEKVIVVAQAFPGARQNGLEPGRFLTARQSRIRAVAPAVGNVATNGCPYVEEDVSIEYYVV
jgi:hypothetical protein